MGRSRDKRFRSARNKNMALAIKRELDTRRRAVTKERMLSLRDMMVNQFPGQSGSDPVKVNKQTLQFVKRHCAKWSALSHKERLCPVTGGGDNLKYAVAALVENPRLRPQDVRRCVLRAGGDLHRNSAITLYNKAAPIAKLKRKEKAQKAAALYWEQRRQEAAFQKQLLRAQARAEREQLEHAKQVAKAKEWAEECRLHRIAEAKAELEREAALRAAKAEGSRVAQLKEDLIMEIADGDWPLPSYHPAAGHFATKSACIGPTKPFDVGPLLAHFVFGRDRKTSGFDLAPYPKCRSRQLTLNQQYEAATFQVGSFDPSQHKEIDDAFCSHIDGFIAENNSRPTKTQPKTPSKPSTSDICTIFLKYHIFRILFQKYGCAAAFLKYRYFKYLYFSNIYYERETGSAFGVTRHLRCRFVLLRLTLNCASLPLSPI